MGKLFGGFFLVALGIAILIVGPFCSIWAFNTLFPTLVIPYTWETWLAVVVIGSLVLPNRVGRK